MTDTMEKTELKKQLLEICRQKQTEAAKELKASMDEVQESANEEQGSTEEKFESFRTQLQQDRDMYARQYADAQERLEVLYRISPSKLNTSVDLGAVVITDVKQKFFISISLGEIKHETGSYFAISTAAPIYETMDGKKVGDSFEFRGRKYKITEIF